MKLIHAISNTNNPMMLNNFTYSIFPPVFTQSLYSSYRCHFFIGCRMSVWFLFSFGSFWTINGPSFFESASIEAPSFTSSTVLRKLLVQRVLEFLTHSTFNTLNSNGARNSNQIEVLGGISFNTPVTVTLYSLSIRMVLPIGFSLPKRVLASVSVNTIEFGSFNAVSTFPLISGKENIFKKSGSTYVPRFLNFWLPIIKL